ncbi:MAG: hypothetical protein IH987_15420 [Planctomycetes bacterium]|nr:hypothetical protein [Planctomycetota bacterium]
MKINKTKAIALATLAGGTVLGGGCLGGIPWTALLWGAALDTGLEWVGDNNAVFDLFCDGETSCPAAGE